MKNKFVILIAPVALIFLLIIMSGAVAMNSVIRKYETVKNIFLTNNLEEITEPEEREFYSRVLEESAEMKNNKNVNIDVALFVSTFTIIEGYDYAFSYSLVTTEMISDLFDNQYIKKVTIYCSTIDDTDELDRQIDDEDVETSSTECAEGDQCNCPDGSVEEGSDITYNFSHSKYKQYLKSEFLPLVISEELIYEDGILLEERLDEIITEIYKTYDEILAEMEADADLSFFTVPVDTSYCVITSPYGERIDPISYTPTFHYGIDIVSRPREIYAIGDGTVVSVRSDVIGKDTSKGYGNVIFIDHEIDGMTYQSVYAHLEYGSIKVKAGDYVLQGDNIAIMGTTGYSTGVHLHFEVKLKGERVNPNGMFYGMCPKSYK